MGERRHLIGPVENPVYICLKKEVPKLFTSFFYMLYEAWEYYHSGLGFPGKKIEELDPDYVKMIISMENHYKRHFSTSQVIIKYMEAVINRLDVLIGAPGRRR